MSLLNISQKLFLTSNKSLDIKNDAIKYCKNIIEIFILVIFL